MRTLKLNFKPSKFVRAISLIGFVAYLLILLYLTVFKRVYLLSGTFFEQYTLDWRAYYRFSVNLIPFKTVFGYLTGPSNTNIIIENLLGNIMAFVPLGFLAPVVLKKIRNYNKIVSLSVVTSILIEFTQLLLKVGSTDIDDIILNTFGGFIGYILLRIFVLFFQKRFNRQNTKHFL